MTDLFSAIPEPDPVPAPVPVPVAVPVPVPVAVPVPVPVAVPVAGAVAVPVATPAPRGIDLTAVIPVLDEAPSLPELYNRLRAAVASLGMTYEFIFVDDGSTDDTPRILAKLAAEDPQVRVASFRRNFGIFGRASLNFGEQDGFRTRRHRCECRPSVARFGSRHGLRFRPCWPHRVLRHARHQQTDSAPGPAAGTQIY